MLDKLFLQILNMSFTASIVIMFVFIARLLLKNAPKIFSYVLWSVVLFRLLSPFSFESFFSLLPTNTNPISQDIVYMQTPKVNTGITILNNSVNSVLPAATPHASVNPLQISVFIGSLIWLLGIAVLFVYSIVSLIRLLRLLQNSTHYKDNIFLSDRIDTAFVMGVFYPYIYLPSTLKDAERDYIILHEQTHIKRLDHIVKLISFFALCIHWFNPLVWVSFFLSGKDMEMTCDEAVLKKLGNNVKKDYSSSLLTLATGKRIVGGTPLAFGEGNTKSRIKNVLNYKKPTFWLVLVAVMAVVFVVIGLMTNPKEGQMGFSGINAVILEIDKENKTMTVEGIDKNSVIGDKCIVTWDGQPFMTVATNSGPTRLSLDDFALGDFVVLFADEVQESYPTRIKATTIQLWPKEIPVESYSAENLWNARTKYIGDNSAVGKLLGLIPLPGGLNHNHFELHTDGTNRGLEWFLDEAEKATYNENQFDKPALLLFALIDNMEDFYVTTKDPFGEGTELHYDRAWADKMVSCDVRDYAQSSEKLRELISFIKAKVDSAHYSISKLGKNGEVISNYSLKNEQLAEAVIMDCRVKAAVFEGVDIKTLDESYLIRQTFPAANEIHDYYAYLLDGGTAVLQTGIKGHYSIISSELYVEIVESFN